ncbi:hypothetical protein BH10PSE17_BH10PSE17_04640 [soil metagenome]
MPVSNFFTMSAQFVDDPFLRIEQHRLLITREVDRNICITPVQKAAIKAALRSMPDAKVMQGSGLLGGQVLANSEAVRAWALLQWSGADR